ncbi:MAG: hypothetical protein WAL61_11545, partial [Acidimicrobiales bacterium]
MAPPGWEGATVAESVTGCPTTAGKADAEIVTTLPAVPPPEPEPVFPEPPVVVVVVGFVTDPLKLDPASWGLMAALE